jgi:hypothetical protein
MCGTDLARGHGARWRDAFASYLARVLVENRGLCSLSLDEHRRIHDAWLATREGGLSPLELDLPWITVSALRCLERLPWPRARNDTRAFEYGSGGSTFFLRRLAAEVVTVEHDAGWHSAVCERMRDAGISTGSIHLVLPESGAPELHAGEEADPGAYRSADPAFAKSTFRGYASFIDRFPRGHFDLVLVDGRSRPSCLAHALPALREGGILVLDNAERSYYLAAGLLQRDDLECVHTGHGALVASAGFTRTDIYRRIR